MTRKYNTTPVTYWGDVLAQNITLEEIAVEHYLNTNSNAPPSGLYVTANQLISTYTGIDAKRIEVILKSLETKGRIMTSPGGWIWLIEKYEHEAKNPRVILSVFYDLDASPIELRNKFIKRYANDLSCSIENELKFSERMRKTIAKFKTDSPPQTPPENEKKKEKEKEKEVSRPSTDRQLTVKKDSLSLNAGLKERTLKQTEITDKNQSGLKTFKREDENLEHDRLICFDSFQMQYRHRFNTPYLPAPEQQKKDIETVNRHLKTTGRGRAWIINYLDKAFKSDDKLIQKHLCGLSNILSDGVMPYVVTDGKGNGKRTDDDAERLYSGIECRNCGFKKPLKDKTNGEPIAVTISELSELTKAKFNSCPECGAPLGELVGIAV